MADETVTPKKHLSQGRPVWPGYRGHESTLRQSRKADVVVVGAGISGAFMAHSLSRHYDNVIVLDRRIPAHGATSASTAMLQYEIDTPLTELAGKIGHADAARAWKRSFRATQDLVRLIRDEGIRCGLSRRAALYLTGNEMGARGMEREARARNRIGLACEFLSASELRDRFTIHRTGAIWSDGAAIADPVALAGGLLRRARQHGARVFAHAEVRGILPTCHGVVLEAGDHIIEARAVVFCTGYEVLKGLPPRGARITSSWAAATAPHAVYPGWLDRTLVWEAAKPYLYMRTTPDGRLVVGGEDAAVDSPAYRAANLESKAARLAGKTKKLIGVTPRWTHRWAGAFGESADGLPLIGAVPGMPHCFAVMGFGGNGTVYSMIAAQMMPGLIAGRKVADSGLFAFRD